MAVDWEARAEEAEAWVRELEAERDRAVAHARAVKMELAEDQQLQSEIAALERTLDTALATSGRVSVEKSAFEARAYAAEARIRELEAELKHITGLLDDANAALERPSRRELAAEQKLADANALLRKMREHVLCPLTWHKPIDAHLAAQPAAPGVCPTNEWQAGRAYTDDNAVTPVVVAELARRGLK